MGERLFSARQVLSSVAVALLLVGPAVRADVVAVVVPGTADPWLAGMPNGSTASSGDVAPAESPVRITGLNYAGGGVLTFSVKGSVNYAGAPPTDPPDGDVNYVIHHATAAENGMSDVVSPVDALMAVFLAVVPPNAIAAPATLDFSTPASRDYTTLSPLLQQVFFVGDGLTSTNVVQQIQIPVGATAFYLGTMDGFGWSNNSGSFNVQVTGPGHSAVPEPGPLVLAGTGILVVLGICAWKRRSVGRLKRGSAVVPS
jgi:hypothetical protein